MTRLERAQLDNYAACDRSYNPFVDEEKTIADGDVMPHDQTEAGFRAPERRTMDDLSRDELLRMMNSAAEIIHQASASLARRPM